MCSGNLIVTLENRQLMRLRVRPVSWKRNRSSAKFTMYSLGVSTKKLICGKGGTARTVF